MYTHEIKPAIFLDSVDRHTLSRLNLVQDFGAVITPKPSSFTQIEVDETRKFASQDVPYKIETMRERHYYRVSAMENGSTDPLLQSIPPALKKLLYKRTAELSDATGSDYSKWRLHFNQAKTLFLDWHFDDRISLFCVIQLPGDRRMRYFQPPESERLSVRNYAAYGSVKTRNEDVRNFMSQRSPQEISRLNELDSAFFNCHFLHASGTEPIGMTITIGME